MHLDPPLGWSATRVFAAFGPTEHLATEAAVAYVDGELSMTAYQRAAAHLSACAECAADVDAQGRMRSAVRSAPPLTIPAGLRGVLCRIPQAPVPGTEALPSSVPRGVVVGVGDPAPSRPAEHRSTERVHPPTAASSPRRGRRSLPLGVLTVSALAVGVLAATAASPDPASQVTDPHLGVVAVPAQRGAEVLPARTAPHAQLVSFAIMFAGSADAPATTQIRSVQTRTSP